MEADAAAQVAALGEVNAVLEMAHLAQAMFRSNEYDRRLKEMKKVDYDD